MPMERKSREERDLSYTAWMDDHDINNDDDNDDDADDDDGDLGRVDG